VKTPLQIAQAAFVEWLDELDGVLLESQREHANGLASLKVGDTKAFGDALGRMAGHVDIAREMISTGMESGFNEPKKGGAS
jgi:hypothetical protein